MVEEGTAGDEGVMTLREPLEAFIRSDEEEGDVDETAPAVPLPCPPSLPPPPPCGCIDAFACSRREALEGEGTAAVMRVCRGFSR